MSEKITLTQVNRKEATSPKTNKPYTRLLLKSQEYGDQFLSGFGNKDNKDWKEGDTVEVEVKKIEKDGKTYLNFETPKKDDMVMIELGKIRMSIGALRNEILNLKDMLGGKTHYPTAEEEGIDPSQAFPEGIKGEEPPEDYWGEEK